MILDKRMKSWVHVKDEKSPLPLTGFTVTLLKNKVILFGGSSLLGRENSHLYEFDLISYEWKPLECNQPEKLLPDGRYGHSMENIDDKLYLFGGRKYWSLFEGIANILYIYDPEESKWHIPRITSESPSERFDHASCATGDSIFIHGGYNYTDLNDLWQYSIRTRTWKQIESRSSPLSRFKHQICVHRDKLYLCGGQTKKYTYNELWSLDLNSKSWKMLMMNEQIPISNFDGVQVGSSWIWSGGDNTSQTKCQNAILSYSFDRNELSTCKVEQISIHEHKMIITGDRILLFGGKFGSLSNFGRKGNVSISDFPIETPTTSRRHSIQIEGGKHSQTTRMKKIYLFPIPKHALNESIFVKRGILEDSMSVAIEQELLSSLFTVEEKGITTPRIKQILDSHESQLIESKLLRLKMTIDDIYVIILQCSMDTSVSLIEDIIHIVPSEETTFKIRSFSDEFCVSIADRFVKKLVEFHPLKERLVAWKFAREYDSRLKTIDDETKVFLFAIKELENEKFYQILSIIIAHTKFFSENNSGFQMKSLGMIKGLVSNDGGSLLDVIRQWILKNSPVLLECVSEFESTHLASKLSLSNIHSTHQEIQEDYLGYISGITRQIGQRIPGDGFSLNVSSKMKDIALRLEVTDHLMSDLKLRLIKMSIGFGETDENGDSWVHAHPERFFIDVSKFIKDLKE